MRLGIIGAGNMGSSILKGVTASNFLENSHSFRKTKYCSKSIG